MVGTTESTKRFVSFGTAVSTGFASAASRAGEAPGKQAGGNEGNFHRFPLPSNKGVDYMFFKYWNSWGNSGKHEKTPFRCPPKAEVVSSNLAGSANHFNDLDDFRRAHICA